MSDFVATLQEITARLLAGVGALADRMPLILGDPRAYPRESMLLAAIAALVLLLTVLGVYVGYGLVAAAVERRRLGVRRTHPRWPLVLAVLALLPVPLLLVAVALPSLPGTSGACATCHAIVEPVASWESGPHASVACYGCHASGGILGGIEATVRGAGMRLAGRESSQGVAPTTFTNGCVDCHDEIVEGVVGEVVVVRHSDIIEGGWSCFDCHPDVGHENLERGAPTVVRSVMSECLICHDGQTASSECATCHVGGPMDVAGAVQMGQTTGTITCEGCHSAETSRRCIDCHGLVLPHPAEFFSQHAGLSWNDPDLCERCHEAAAAAPGCGCHAEVTVHGTYTEWFPRHGPEAFATYPGGCNCHAQAFCEQCHTESPF